MKLRESPLRGTLCVPERRGASVYYRMLWGKPLRHNLRKPQTLYSTRCIIFAFLSDLSWVSLYVVLFSLNVE